MQGRPKRTQRNLFVILSEAKDLASLSVASSNRAG